MHRCDESPTGFHLDMPQTWVMGQQQGKQSKAGSSRMQSAGPSLHQHQLPISRTESPSLEEIFGTGGTVPVMFRWTHGGQRVAITGTFNNWATAGIPMVRSGEEFYQVVEVPKCVHQYKFLVDGEWKFSLDQPVLQDVAGNVNNVVDIQYYEKYEPAALRDPIDLEDEEAQWGQENLEPAQSMEPPSAPPLLVRLPMMGIAHTKKTEESKILSSKLDPSVTAPMQTMANGGATNTTSAANIPLFSVCGHMVHDASTSFRGLHSDSLVSTTCIRFAQKYTSTVLVSVNNTAKADGLLRHYGFASGTPPEEHQSHLQSTPQPTSISLPPAVTGRGSHALLQALAGTQPAATKETSGIVKRANSSGSEGFRTKAFDMSTFTD